MNENCYNLPNDSCAAMASEPIGTYTGGNQQIVLTIPKGTDANLVRCRVTAFYTELLNDLAEEQKFNGLFESWWNKTCIYSGANLCYDNEEFQQMCNMGKKALKWIDKIQGTSPDYMQRHINWLKKGIVQ